MERPARALLWCTLLLFVVNPRLIASPTQSPSELAFALPESSLAVKDFSDREIVSGLSTLDRLLAAPSTPEAWTINAHAALWQFARYVQSRRLSAQQESLILRHFDRIAQLHPGEEPVIAGPRYMVSALTIGKKAPEILGTDLDGRPLRLSDHRGQVVVLLFSAEWCGICRSLFPYERLMLELYKQWPFAILSVETGSSPDAIKQIKSAAALPYRSWWDKPDKTGQGPIAASWNVGGYTAVYLLDEHGVIRFVDVRYEDLLKGVRQLLSQTSLSAAARLSE